MKACRVAPRISRRVGPRRPFSASATAWQRPRLSVAELLDTDGSIEEARVQGWVRSIRKQRNVAFASIDDGSTVRALQAVLKPDEAGQLSTGSAVSLNGRWAPSAGKEQSHDFKVTDLEVLGENDAERNPLQPKFQTAEHLRTIPHLRHRVPMNALLLRLRSNLIASLTKFFHNSDFVQAHTPIITSSDCEGAGEAFTVISDSLKDHRERLQHAGEAHEEHFFRSPKYLTVSAQLHLEALALAVDKVWTLSPTFRAEKSDTPRHLSEFYMLEAEMCFVDDLNEVMDLVEKMLRLATEDMYMSGGLIQEIFNTKRAAEAGLAQTSSGSSVTLSALQERWEGLRSLHWPRITYAEAIKELQTAQTKNNAVFESAPSYEGGLQAEHERYIASAVGQGKPVFVTDYPRIQKPFYMPPSPSTRDTGGTLDTVACFDLLVPDLCELVGGSLREHRSEDLTAAMVEKGLTGSNLQWYQDLRKYGSVPHGGFGLGFDRLLCYLSGVSNVRDLVAFPRWYGRCDC